VFVLLEKLGLSEPIEKNQKKRGRPKSAVPNPEIPKRPRGRPRKMTVTKADDTHL
jgi:hypothetical protein